MKRLVVAGLALILSQPIHSFESQISNIQSPADKQFQTLFQQVRDLEKKLENEPEETEQRKYKKIYKTETGFREETIHTGAHNISSKIVELKCNEISKFAARYDISMDCNQSNIFTWRQSLVLELFVDKTIIFDHFSAIVNPYVRSIMPQDEQYHIYQTIKSHFDGNGNLKVIKGKEVRDGLIPYFDTNDFSGIAKKIRELELDQRTIRKDSDPTKSVNQVPEFKGLNFDNTRSRFAYWQLRNIARMLLHGVEDSTHLEGLPIPKEHLIEYNLRVSMRGKTPARIVMSGRTYKRDVDVSNPEALRYANDLSGDLSLSIAADGIVDYHFVRSCCISNQNPIYRTLKIDFSKFDKK